MKNSRIHLFGHSTPVFALVVFSLLAALGCSSMGDQKPAVEKAIKDHLSKRSELAINNMTMEVKDVKVDGDKAGAEVLFRVTSAPEMQMAYHYELARESGSWKVLQGRPAQADSSHPTGSADPSMSDPSALPPGHPPFGGGEAGTSSGLPEDHPPLGEPAPQSGAKP